jgi:alkyl sulfatase BDS1-like metallo-beta-lactamase superfamily hydrolase
MLSAGATTLNAGPRWRGPESTVTTLALVSSPEPIIPRPASEATAAANAGVAEHLVLGDQADFERAAKGRLRTLEPPVVRNAGGGTVWDVGAYAFLDNTCPPEVNPSLWRQGRLNAIHGLFEVCDGIYQVRGYDISNITFVRTDTGWIVIDPLTVEETAAAARALVDTHFGRRPILAIIYTHSHVDHYGGVRGIVTDEEVTSGAVRIIAPAGFLESAISENVIAGPAMTRRAMYMYGILLPKGIHGHVDAGLGKSVPFGGGGLIAPTEHIETTGTELVIDGVRIQFQLTPGTEAPAEMNFLFPDHRAVCMAENCTATLHNLYTPRGAEIRDALGWSRYIDEALEQFIDRVDVAFASHHWPRWGAPDIEAWLGGQRDIYRYIHDETMRLANHGLTATEIAETVRVPPALGDEFFNRDYYGTINHNVKAVYQRYLGWFDANPANLHPLPPVETARKFVEYMGDADAVLTRARADFDAGEYRWVAQVVNHVVFADPSNREARLLQADALEQLGYQAESGPWRAFYLTGAQELRNGTPNVPGLRGAARLDVLRAMTPRMVLDNCAMKLNAPAAVDLDLRFDVRFTDRDEAYRVRIQHGVLTYGTRRTTAADATIRTSVEALVKVASAIGTVDAELASGAMTIEGNPAAFDQFVSLLDQFELFFPIIEP